MSGPNSKRTDVSGTLRPCPGIATLIYRLGTSAPGPSPRGGRGTTSRGVGDDADCVFAGLKRFIVLVRSDRLDVRDRLVFQPGHARHLHLVLASSVLAGQGHSHAKGPGRIGALASDDDDGQHFPRPAQIHQVNLTVSEIAPRSRAGRMYPCRNSCWMKRASTARPLRSRPSPKRRKRTGNTGALAPPTNVLRPWN